MIGRENDAGRTACKAVSCQEAMREPSYLSLYRSGELARRIEIAWAMLSHCELCPRRCGVNRLDGERGVCRMGALPKIGSWNLHLSHLGYGEVVPVERLSEMMLELQRKGAHNINFVTPTQFVPAILAALPRAIEGGLDRPLVYNTSGYERVEVLRLLEGVIDIWLPDSKYADDATARRLSGFERYVEHNRAALSEIYRQVGPDLKVDEEGIARRGMIVRHMVLPQGLAGSAGVLHWIAEHLSPEVHVSLMDQYFPAHRALGDPVLGRKITWQEYQAALEAFDAAGLARGWRQCTLEDE